MAEREERPNIVWIMADDMGFGDPGCYNPDSKIPTPNMDRVAAEGMRFTDAHSASAVCTPSRYGVITGRYCWRTRLKSGVLGGYGPPLIETDRPTVASLLKRHDYATAAIGKWHLGLGWTDRDGNRGPWSDWNDEEVEHGFALDYTRPIWGGPNELGFDRFFGIAGSLDMPPYCFIQDDHTVGIPDHEKETYYAQQRRGPAVEGWDDRRVDVRFAETAVEWLEERAGADRPFFLYLTTSAPHRPCVGPEFIRGASDAGDRGDMVALFDWVVGRVTDTLDRLGVADDTLLVVTSDNGAREGDVDGSHYGHKSCGDWRGFKGDAWDGGHREPFIARWPGRIPAGAACDRTVCLGDFVATCADLLGAELPEGAAPDSVSILALLLGRSDGPVREAVVHHSLSGHFCLRRGKWKAIFGLGSGGFSEPRGARPGPDDPPGQLYDMESDPAETTNVWLEHPDVVEELTAILERYRESGRSVPR
ncbi:MAG: sulfatase family protein [Planctomycetota bacterium]